MNLLKLLKPLIQLIPNQKSKLIFQKITQKWNLCRKWSIQHFFIESFVTTKISISVKKWHVFDCEKLKKYVLNENDHFKSKIQEKI